MSHNDDDVNNNIIIKFETVVCLENKILCRLVKAKATAAAAAADDDVDDIDDGVGVDQQQQQQQQQVVAASVVADLVDDAVELLQNQWPQQQHQQSSGSASYYYYYHDKLIHHRTSGENYGLPCSYLLVVRREVNNNNNGDSCCGNKYCLLGHGRLTECYESTGGTNAAAATYIVINPMYRKQGFGIDLMRMLEKEAKKLGYHYMYLWTQTAIQFYTHPKLGYKLTEKVSLHRACLKKLQHSQVSLLESMLSSRQQQIMSSPSSPSSSKRKKENTTTTSSSETVLLLPSDGGAKEAENDDVWLRKRLVESVGSVNVPIQQRIEEMSKYIIKNNENGISTNSSSSTATTTTTVSNNHNHRWVYQIVSIPWQQQVGPSCGLAALRMIRDHYYYCSEQHQQQQGDNNNINNDDCRQMPSLLATAQENNYTVDGEIFDIDNLFQLATSDCCGCELECSQRLFSQTSIQDISNILERNGVIILPYDSSPGTRRPCCKGGHQAHYGIIVGMLFDVVDDSTTTASSAACGGATALEPYNKYTHQTALDAAAAAAAAAATSNVKLLVQQSLGSSKLVIAPWNEWYNSNNNLVSIDGSKYQADRLNLRDQLLVVHGGMIGQ